MKSDKKKTSSLLRLTKAIMSCNEKISWADAKRLALEAINYESRKKECSGKGLTFGMHKGKVVSECPKDYIIWLASVVEEKKHTPEFLRAIREARSVVLSWQDMSKLPQDCPFDV